MRLGLWNRKWSGGALFGALLMAVGFAPAPAAALELVMFQQVGCPYCAEWNAAVGPGYPKSTEGKLAPLRRVDIHQPIPADLAGVLVEPVTPVFVVVDNGKEIGRIRGYPGADFFWFLLDQVLAKVPATQ
jgi:hypothetical protein